MRKTFTTCISELAAADGNVRLLTADLGFGLFDSFAQRQADQFLNCGLAEPAMVGIAAGLAISGLVPFVYSIAPFIVLRSYEQIKLDIGLPGLNVKLVGVGAGVGYSHAGVSHYSLEDVGLMSAIPGMRIYNPADKEEVRECFREMMGHPGPAYLRLANQAAPEAAARPRMRGSDPIEVRTGKRGTVFTTGHRLNALMERSEFFEKWELGLVHLPVLEPVNRELIAEIAARVPYVFTIDDQYRGLGLGRILSTIIAERDLSARCIDLGFVPGYNSIFGETDYLRKCFRSEEDSILEWIR